MNIKKISRLSVLLALSVVLNILESYLPFFSGVIPGLKIGLANIIILFTIYIYGFKESLILSVLRVVLVGILRTGLFSLTFFFSLSGSLLSVVVMSLFRKTKLSVIGVSVLGSLSHCSGQIIIAIFLINKQIIYYLPYLLLFALPTGILIGYLGKEIIKYFEKDYMSKNVNNLKIGL